MHTIKEAAGILGISKQGLKYWLDRLGIPLEKGKTGRYVITDETLHRVQQAREAKSEVTSEAASKETSKPTRGTAGAEEPKGEAQSEAVSEATSEVSAALVELLREDLRVMREELREKNAQIKSLTAQLSDTTEALKSAQRSLEQAQILHAKSVNLLPDAAQTEPEPEDGKEAETRTQPGEDPKPRKKTLWERITGKGR